jgi:endonuclease-3
VEKIRPRKARARRTIRRRTIVRRTTKRPFDIDEIIRQLRAAIRPYTPAAMFQLFDEGYTSVFEILVACIISIRTFEEATLPTARKLFAVARTPDEVAKLSVKQIDDLIHTCTFHEPKARTIRDIAIQAVDRFGGELPCEFEALTSFRGVGPKCANLALGIACNQPHGIGVDIHVHRVTNRWGYVSAPSPEQTMVALEAKLPKKYWIEINKLLVPFGKHICTARLPRCSSCPLLEYCRQIGVMSHR